MKPVDAIFRALAVCCALSGPVHAACSCTDMTIKYRNAVGGAWSTNYCVDSGEMFDECQEVLPNTCGSGKKTWHCPIGGAYGTDTSGDHWIGAGFELVATLGASTSLADCSHGQGIQRNIEEDTSLNANGATGHALPAGPVAYPGVNAWLYANAGSSDQMPHIDDTDVAGHLKFAADDYAALSSTQTIRFVSPLLSWSDLPSVYLDSGDTAKLVKVTDRFLASVRDATTNAVQCGCMFKVEAVKNVGTNNLSAVQFTPEAGLHCTYTPQP